MTTMELNAMRGELAREILNIENIELLQKVQRYLKRAMKTEKEEVEYIEKEEILNSIREGLRERRGFPRSLPPNLCSRKRESAEPR